MTKSLVTESPVAAARQCHLATVVSSVDITTIGDYGVSFFRIGSDATSRNILNILPSIRVIIRGYRSDRRL